MKEVFYEESCELQNFGRARTRYIFMTVLMIFSYVAAFALALVALAGWLSHPLTIVIVILFAIGFLVTAIVYQNKRESSYLDFDYTFVTGSVQIASVIRKKRRQTLIAFEAEDVITIGKVGSKTYEKHAASPDTKPLFATLNNIPMEGRDFYYIFVNAPTLKEQRKGKNYKRKLIVMECSETFLAHVRSFAPHGVLEKDF